MFCEDLEILEGSQTVDIGQLGTGALDVARFVLS